jgi:hypothetical protein
MPQLLCHPLPPYFRPDSTYGLLCWDLIPDEGDNPRFPNTMYGITEQVRYGRNYASTADWLDMGAQLGRQQAGAVPQANESIVLL